MSFLEKHYPDVALSREFLQNRLRQLESRLQERNKNIHLTHHIEIENNITHLYDLLTKITQKQTSMQTQINLFRNKSAGVIFNEKSEHKQKLNQLKHAYKLAQDKAYSLKKRIQGHHSNFVTKPFQNQHIFSSERLNLNNRILQQKILLQQQASKKILSKVTNDSLKQQELLLRELSRQNQLINLISMKQYSPQNYYSHQKSSFQVPLNRSNTYSKLQATQFNRINSALQKMNSELNNIYNPAQIYNHQIIEQQSQNQMYDKKRNNNNIGKLYSRKGQCQNNVTYKQHESNSKNERIVNKFNLSVEQKNALDKTQLKQDDSEQDFHHHQSKQQTQTKDNKDDISHSISFSNFKPRFDEVLDQQSEEGNDIFNQTTNKTQNKQKGYNNQIQHKRRTSCLSTIKRSISAKKKRQNRHNKDTIHKNILSRIKSRADHAWAIYQDSTFRNVKHQHEHLFNTFKLESRLREQVCSKIFKHHLAERKFGVI